MKNELCLRQSVKSVVGIAMIALFTYSHQLFSQEMPVYIDVFPPSPNASSIAKFGDIPVSQYTGTPNISIPLNSAKSGSIEVPISLSYHASGIRVDELASWIGLGWTLSAGGAISRTTRGLPDDSPNGFLNTPAIPASIDGSNLETFQDYYKGIVDSQADVFHVNAPGLSFKFYFQKNGDIITVPVQNVKIEKTVNQGISSFLVKSSNGQQYLFSSIEESETETIGADRTTNNKYASSWYLTEIISPFGHDRITFDYSDYYTDYLLNSTETAEFDNTLGETFTYQKIWGKRLSKITSDAGSIEFIASTIERSDLRGDYALESIMVKDPEGQLISKYGLEYNYFDTNGISAYTPPSSAGEDLNKRLRLTSIKQYGNEDSLSPLSHEFEYNEDILLPARNSKSQDMWGYYNGQYTNTTLIPEQKLAYLSDGIKTFNLLKGANREVSEQHMKAAQLKKIYYPTGGHSEFEFEPHTCESFWLKE